MRKSRTNSAGRLRILRKGEVGAIVKSRGESGTMANAPCCDQHAYEGSLEGGTMVLNDPEQAREFVVVWEVG